MKNRAALSNRVRCVSAFIDRILVSVPHTIRDISIGNNMVSSSIWKNMRECMLYEEQVLFEVFEKLTSACFYLFINLALIHRKFNMKRIFPPIMLCKITSEN